MGCHLQRTGGDGTTADTFSLHAERGREARMNDNVAAVGAA